MAVTVAAVVAFVIGVVATPLAMQVARRTGIVDHPGPLKVQAEPVPYLGGLAVFAAFAAVVAVAHPALLLPLGAAALLGLLDDARGVAPPIRLLAEVAVAAVAASVVPVRFGGPLGPVVVVLAVVGLVNACNMLDGLDALAGGVACVAAGGFAIVLHGELRVVAVGLAGALAGFLVWNRPPARVYLGDAGAYLLGTALAILLVASWSPHHSAATGAGGLALVALPVMEAAITILRRVRAGHHLFAGDRGHVYDRLVDRGWPAWRATLAFVAAEAVLAALAIAVRNARPAVALVVVFGALVLVFAAAIATGFTRPDFRGSGA